MNSRERIEAAWSFREPDRVPVELEISQQARTLPEAGPISDFIDKHADNFVHVPLFSWGFCGLDADYREEVIEDVPGEYRRIRRIYETSAGRFEAVTRHRDGEMDPGDFYWEKRYLSSINDLERFAEADRAARPFDASAYTEACGKVGGRGMPFTGLLHPLGWLLRMSDLTEVYSWLATEKEIVHRFLSRANAQIVASIQNLSVTGIKPVFGTWALEMAIPPWLGREAFDEFVFPYDKAVNDAIHSIGGRHRAHVHGRCGAFLERFAEMGIDSVEPLEPPPYGDTDLAAAKRTVGRRMLLSGNILSQDYIRMSPADVRDAVRKAIRDGAPGGGFTLRCAEGAGGTASVKTVEQLRVCLSRVKAYIEAAMEYGTYPIRV